MKPAPLRTDHDRGADEALVRMCIERPHQQHITTRYAGHYWVDLPSGVYASVHFGAARADLGYETTGKNDALPHYTVKYWANRLDRTEGDTP